MTSITNPDYHIGGSIVPTYRVKLCLTPNILSVDNPDREIVELYNSKITKLLIHVFQINPDSGFDLLFWLLLRLEKLNLLIWKLVVQFKVLIKTRKQRWPNQTLLYGLSSRNYAIKFSRLGYRGTLKFL